jgi:hypothetical protein
MTQIAAWIDRVAQVHGDADALAKIRGEVVELTRRFPAPGLAVD